MWAYGYQQVDDLRIKFGEQAARHEEAAVFEMDGAYRAVRIAQADAYRDAQRAVTALLAQGREI